MFNSPRDTTATGEWSLNRNPRPILGSHQNSAHSNTTFEQSPERHPSVATAIRIQKYRLGHRSRQHAEDRRSSRRLSTRLDPAESLLNLNPPLVKPSMEFAPSDYSRSPQPSRPTTAMSWHRPSYKRGSSSKISQGTVKDVFADRNIPVVQSFTPLPSTISRAAAKRLGIHLHELDLPVERKARGRRSESLLYESDDEATSSRPSTENSIEGYKHQHDVPKAGRAVRDSWPLREGTMSTSQTVESSGEDDDRSQSMISRKSSKTSYSAEFSPRMHEHSPGRTNTQRPPSRAQSRARKLQWLTGSPMPDTGSFDPVVEPAAESPPEPAISDVDVHPAFRPSPGQPSPVHQKRYDFEAHMEEAISPDAAEKVIQCIFERIDSFDDIFAAARINRGFYGVFKRHELELMKRVLYNSSPAEWEYRETCAKEIMPGRRNAQPDYTPTLYVQFHKRDSYILKSLKMLMFSRCQLLLRQETIDALYSQKLPHIKRIDDTIWRIWTFCDIFGSGKGGEDDFVAQKAWLNGGVAQVKPSDGRKSRISRHASASCFGKGNDKGLGIAEMEDMLEVWKCMRFLLKGIMGPGRVAQARRYGLFIHLDVDYSDEVVEEAMLGKFVPASIMKVVLTNIPEEWTHYVLTLGPSTVVDLASLATSKSSNVFKTARDMGWATWRSCPKDGCRSKFLTNVITTLIAERKAEQVRPQIIAQTDKQRQSVDKSKRTSYQNVGAPSLSELDNSVGIWVSWVSKYEEPSSAHPTKPLPQVPVMADRHQRHEPILPSHNMEEGQHLSSRRSPPLSLFPPQYTRSNTPSRSPSLVHRSESERSSETSSIISRQVESSRGSIVPRGMPLAFAMR